MIVTWASPGPRTWSLSVIGGKRDGPSGPGVGAVEKEVQGALVGREVTIDTGRVGSDVVTEAGLQAGREDRTTKDAIR
jgi:hypothetical protein